MKLPYRFGRYTLLKKLANGGMAEVYLAHYHGEEGFTKLVAIKRILPDARQGAQFTESLIDEAKALVHLYHQNIVQVYELGKEEGHFFITMEYVRGIDLARILRKMLRGEITLPLKYALYVVSQILQGLDFVHTVPGPDKKPLNIIHRDVSPPNILCSWHGEVKVADFGIAKGNHRTHQTATDQIKGKYSYMAPEQVCGKQLDQRVDIYAAGIILFELVAGERLYEGDSDIGVIEQVKRSRLPLMKVKDVPPELKAILCTALARNPDDRYVSAAEFLEELNRCALDTGHVACGFEFGAYLREQLAHECDESSEESFFPVADDRYRGVTKQMDVVEADPDARHRWFVGRSFRRGVIVSMLLLSSMIFPASAARKGELRIAPVRVDAKTVTLEAPKVVEKSPSLEAVLASGAATKPLPAVPKQHESAGFGRISVSAQPWGLVTVPGYAARRETPLRGIKVKAGDYVVRVDHGPTGKHVFQKVTVRDGDRVSCFARFIPKASIACR